MSDIENAADEHQALFRHARERRLMIDNPDTAAKLFVEFGRAGG